jgi:hypothetical protein
LNALVTDVEPDARDQMRTAMIEADQVGVGTPDVARTFRDLRRHAG